MQAALRGMVDRPFLHSQRYQEQQQRANMEGAHPDIVEFTRCFPKRLARQGIPVFASECIRTPERQDDLYALGNSKAKGGQSPHQTGQAVDIVHSVHGWSLSKMQWDLIGHVGRELVTQKGLNLVWGGGWPDFYDPAHWQIADWKVQRADYPFPTLPKWQRNWRKLLLQS